MTLSGSCLKDRTQEHKLCLPMLTAPVTSIYVDPSVLDPRIQWAAISRIPSIFLGRILGISAIL